MIVDAHVHSTFSIDGISTMEEHCIQAVKKNIGKLCFTEHVDFNINEYNMGKTKDNRKQSFDIERYFDEIKKLNDKYSTIEILSGVEFSEPHLFQEEYLFYKNMPFDYMLASIHHCYNGVFPGKANISEKKAIREYYTLMKETLEFCDCQAIAHLDFPRRYFDSWDVNEEIIDEILALIIKKNIALEINTSSINREDDEPLPKYSVIEKYRQLGGLRVIFGSDAHECGKLANNFDIVRKNISPEFIVGYIKNRIFVPIE